VALRSYESAIVAIEQLAQRLCGITNGPPGRPIVATAIKSSMRSLLGAHSKLLELPLVSPTSRHPLAWWGESWAASIRTTLQGRVDDVPEPAPEPQDTEEAA